MSLIFDCEHLVRALHKEIILWILGAILVPSGGPYPLEDAVRSWLKGGGEGLPGKCMQIK